MRAWPKLLGGALALALLLPAGFMLLVDAERYRPALEQQVAASTGARLVLEQPLRWQLWPLGLKLPALRLEDAGGQPLFKAQAGALPLNLGSLLRAQPQPRALVLRDIDLYYQARPEGGTNWTALLSRLRGQASTGALALELERLHVYRLQPERQVADIARLSLAAPQGGQRALALSFHLLPMGLTAWGQLQGQLDEAGLKALQLKAELGSPRIPGTLQLQVAGDLALSPTRWSSAALEFQAAYKHLAMDQPSRARLKAVLDVDLARGELSLNQGELDLAGLRFSELKARAQPLAQGIEFAELQARLGAGRVALPATLVLENEQPVLRSQVQVQGLDLQTLAAWLGAPAMRGLLDAQGELSLAQWDQADLLSAAQGDLEVQLQNLEAGAGGSLAQRLQEQAAFLPPLAQPMPALPKALSRLTLSNHLAAGVIHSRIQADWGLAQAELKGSYTPAARAMRYQGQLTLAPALFAGGQSLRLPLECEAQLEEQISLPEAFARDCGIAKTARRELMARALK